jgi:asparagine synthase (glutamine-hydrolysing)
MSAICGFFGKYGRQADAGQELAYMLAALERRGPDSCEGHRDAAAGLALGFRGLKATAEEVLPGVMASEDNRLLLVCDGHVFNRRELEDRLRSRRHRPRTSHSSELLLHLYEEEGIDGLRRVDGQFAFALYDSVRRKLLLGRDFLGVRPIYFSASPDGVLFGSEIKSILEHSAAPRAIDEGGISHYLTFLTVPGPRTLFANIQKVPPGTVVECSADGAVSFIEYWDLLQDPVAERDDERFYVDRVRELHHASVQRRNVDGPVGALLSGGNDSSANASLMARQGCHPLHTFTVGLAELEGNAKYNDLIYAKRVADLIHSEHHELLLSTDEFLASIPVTVDAMDDMVSEPSSVFLYHALRLAKEQGLRTVITGEANDELCCGHGEMIRIRQRYYERWAPYMRKSAWMRKMAGALSPVLFPSRQDMLVRAAKNEEYFWNFEIAWMDPDKPSILTPAAWERCRNDLAYRVVEGYGRKLRASEHGRRDYLNYIIYVMMQDYYFGNLMLGKLDLLASHVSVEARCPYTEPAYAHFVYNVPAQFKLKNGLVKYFFKKAIEGVLPDDIIYRPKQGFRTPVVELFRGALGNWAEPILMESGLTRAGFLRREHLADLLRIHRAGQKDYSTRLWTTMALNLWHDRWIQTERQRRTPARVSESSVATYTSAS